MITKSLSNALDELGFTYCEGESSDKSHSYAIYGGYLVSVYESAGKRTAYFNFKFSESEENDLKKYDISESFSGNLEEYSVVDYDLNEDGLRVVSNGSIPVFLRLIDYCIELLIENEIKGVEYCSKCGNKFGQRKPKKITLNKENRIMCDHCALETVEEINNSNVADTKVNSTGNIGLGILGSTIFGLIGAFLYFVLYYWVSPKMGNGGGAHYIFCIMGTAVALLSYLGYRLFCKKISAAAYITVSVTSLLFTAVGQYIGTVFEFIALNGFSASVLNNKHFWLLHLRNTVPSDVSANFVNYSADFYKFLAISIMFAAVGAAIFLLSLRDKSIVKKETAVIETLTIG